MIDPSVGTNAISQGKLSCWNKTQQECDLVYQKIHWFPKWQFMGSCALGIQEPGVSTQLPGWLWSLLSSHGTKGKKGNRQGGYRPLLLTFLGKNITTESHLTPGAREHALTIHPRRREGWPGGPAGCLHPTMAYRLHDNSHDAVVSLLVSGPCP